MAGRKTIDKVILAILVLGAVVFVLLLAGVGSELFTDPKPYIPPGS
jgi:hypothetical protein